MKTFKETSLVSHAFPFLFLLACLCFQGCSGDTEEDDPSCELIVLFDSKALSGAGHMALTLVDPNGVCTYFSFNLESLKEHKDYGSVSGFYAQITRYDKTLNISVTGKQYRDMMDQAEKSMKKLYGFFMCHHFVAEVLSKGGVAFDTQKAITTPAVLFADILAANPQK